MNPQVVSIGVFDGVHCGHRALLARARALADARGLPLVALTFDPHPMSVVGPRQAPTSLASLEYREELLLEAGADRFEILAFDESMSTKSPDSFVRDVLIERLNAAVVVVGSDFHYGKGAAGNVETLALAGRDLGFDVVAVELTGDDEDRWSSTRIRGLVEGGDVRGAAAALGRPYRLEGTVVHGDHRGRELGYPTANVAWTGTPAIPGDGVYAGWLTVQGERYPSAISVGTNETFDGKERRVEAYVLDRHDLELYGAVAWVDFVRRIRGQERFESVEALVERMADDVEQARQVLV